MGPYWTILDYTGPYGTIWDLTGPYGAIRDLMGPYRTLRDLTGPYINKDDHRFYYLCKKLQLQIFFNRRTDLLTDLHETYAWVKLIAK